MAFEQGDFEGGEDEAAETEQLSSLWLADLRALPEFTELGDEGKYLLDRIVKTGRAVSLFASMQKRRQQALEASGGSKDIIATQLRDIKRVIEGSESAG